MYPLTQTQLGIYIESTGHENEKIYHMPILLRLPVGTDSARMKAAIETVVAAHPGLSARIVTDNDGTPCWTAGQPIAVETIAMTEDELLANPETLMPDFNLDGGTLARIILIDTGDRLYYFHDMHHTIFDGAARMAYFLDLNKAYAGEDVTTEEFSIHDIAREEIAMRGGEALVSAAAAYHDMLAGCEPEFDLAPDRNGGNETYDTVTAELGIGRDYLDFCRAAELPQSVPATAAMALVMRAYCRRDDVTFATIYHGRKDEHCRRTAAMMVKTLPVRTTVDNATTIGSLLEMTKHNLKTARDNDLYSFAEAARDFGVNSDLLFAYQGEFLDLPDILGHPADEIPLKYLATGSKLTINLCIAGSAMIISAEYRGDLYSASLIHNIIDSYTVVLSEMMTLPAETPVCSLPVASAETEQLAVELGKGGASHAGADDTIPSLFMRAASTHADKNAVIYDGKAFTYREIDELSNGIARKLIDEYGVSEGTNVGIMIERGPLMVILPMAVMKAGGTYMPLDHHFPQDRLQFMIEDAGVGLILSDDGLASSVLPNFNGSIIDAGELAGLRDTDPVCLTRPASPMVILYTSGSTGKPKGVTLTQHNIVNFCAAYSDLTGINDTDITGAYATFGFDAHMMDLYPPLAAGATVHIFDSELRLDLTAMHDYIESNAITVMFMTTQIAWQMATLFEFPHLRLMMGGGEKLPPLDPRPYRFINLYGPTECSVIATAFEVKEPTDGKLIGRPINGYDIMIADRNLRPLPAGVAGELVILGDGVGCGYLNRPDLTAEKFVEIDGKRAYRTGDLARFSPSGDIEFMGRMDGLVKLRGLRIELGEIEAVATSHPAVKTFVAAVKEIAGMENLAGYYITKDGEDIEPEALQEFMHGELTEFMVPEVMMRLEKMPLTPNGKVDRRALPVPEIKTEKIVEPSTDAERRLFDIAASILKHTGFGVTTNLLSVGLTSLLAMRLVASIMKETGVKVSAKNVMSAPTVREIAAFIESRYDAAGNDAPAPEAQRKGKRRYYPLTENQRGVYIDWEMNREALQYNIPQAFRFAPGTDPQRLRDAVLRVIEAHPGLLTRLMMRNGDVVQYIPDEKDIEISITELSETPDSGFFQSLIHPFDLLDEPLFRCSIFTCGDDVYMLRDTHHIIFDGVSAMIFQSELSRAYNGDALEPEEYTALDRALEESDLLESAEADKASEWFDSLIGESEPTSYPRSANPDGDIAGEMGRICLPMPSDSIRKFCAKGGITVSNYLMSAFMQLLHRITREETVQITTVNNGRADIRLLSDTGMFVKTLPIVSRCKKPDMSPAEFALQLQQQFLTSQDYDFYPFTALVERKGVRPDTMFVYEGGIDLNGSATGLKCDKIPLALDTAKVPLTVLVFEPSANEYELVAEYDSSLYGSGDITTMLEMLRTLSLALPQCGSVADAPMTSAAQEQELALLRKGTECDVPYSSFHGAMEMHADNTPDAPALVACDRRLSYGEFDRECNRIANALIRRGVCHGDRIVVLLPRRASLITAIYGAMKTGSAYIPCDPDYPAERIRLITEDSGAKFIITTADRVDLYPGKAVCIDELLEETDDSRPSVAVQPEDVAYMIYTSGSTGRPKGVMIPQRAITNYLYGYYDMFYRDRPEVKNEMLLVTISFDASLNNLGVSLTSGHCLVLANEEECKDVVLLAKLMLDNDVHSFDITPSRLDAMLDLPEFREAISRCHHLNIGGEGFRTTLVDKLFDAGFKGLAINEYGPTETTVGSNQASLVPGSPIVAGKPFCNDTQRIIDGWGAELPVGAVGELYIFGRGVGLGYNNLPEKTAETYVNFKGERGYRTGDLARWTPDGDIVILGRIDHQVKLRGLRIELGEIESVASQFEGIKNVAADVREVNKIQHLALYYTADTAIDKEALQQHLAATLTEYMVPDAYTQVDEMPLTPNGKINRKMLPEPEIAPLTPYVEPEGELEKLIAGAYAKILGNERIGANDDFFGIGGTSISAIKVVALLAGSGYAITYKDVFSRRTPRGLAALLNGDSGNAEAVPSVASPSAAVTRSEFTRVLDLNTLEAYLEGEKQQLGNVLLTGATGFMGIHMLHDLLMNTESGITCHVRGKGGLSAESRLRTMLFYYFDDTFDEQFASGRLRVIEGDVTEPLGADADKLGIDTVINCAANVKHFSAGNDIELVNVESVSNLIAFCLRTGARLVHVSTVSVAGESVNGYPDPSLRMTERMLDFGQSLANQYVHSKYEAERLILTAIRDNGLNAKIMRVGNLSPRASDGEFQINFRSNAFMGSLKAYVTLGCVPYAALDAECEFSPIDEVCRAIILLASTPVDMPVFMPCNNHRLPLGDVLHIISESGLDVRPVENAEFIAARNSAMEDLDKSTVLQPLLAYDSGSASRNAFIRYDASFTNQILYRLGFRWNYTSREYVSRFLRAIESLNFFAL